MPLWLVGYNCYQFDNCALEYHAPRTSKRIFRAINSGAKSVSRHAFYIDLLGINNVDLYSYLDKCLRRKYTALSLGAVAQYHGIGGKTQMPTSEDESTLYKLIDYNINDSRLTSVLWHRTDANKQILGLCVASCAPIIDCVRYVTGTMASCAVSSYCISNSMLMDWSECNLRIGYEGGTVLEPIRSLFRHVTVCDFSAMYPTIIKDIGISPENIYVLADCSKTHRDKILWWNDRCTLACIKGKVIKYITSADCMTRNVLRVITKLRNEYKRSNVSYSTALKVLANSLYGALGFASSLYIVPDVQLQ
jgi:DNA polymerase elongation subunit (family B)